MFHSQSRGEFFEVDDALQPGDVSLGPLAERLVSCLFPESIVPDSRLLNEDSSPLKSKSGRTVVEIMNIEERIKNELSFLGIGTTDSLENGQNHDLNDEISLELKKYQSQLREQIQINTNRKARVRAVAEKWMAYQEYNNLLDEVSKTIQTTYSKRYLPVKKSKRKLPADGKLIPEGLMTSVRARKKLIDSVGNVYFNGDELQIVDGIFEELIEDQATDLD